MTLIYVCAMEQTSTDDTSAGFFADSVQAFWR